MTALITSALNATEFHERFVSLMQETNATVYLNATRNSENVQHIRFNTVTQAASTGRQENFPPLLLSSCHPDLQRPFLTHLVDLKTRYNLF